MTRRNAIAIGWTALLLAACLAPVRWLDLHEEPFSDFGPFRLDKLIHATLFAGYTLVWASSERGRGEKARVLCIGLVLTVLTELVQGVPLIRRDPDPFDALADVAGLIIGYSVIQALALASRISRCRGT